MWMSVFGGITETIIWKIFMSPHYLAEKREETH